ncbi:ribonuclease HII [Shewanella fidelis]|uniref:Ribonuclease HII n=1 Tax=Shewanella fidelis TaxID=173509 RepID=A0AAW8NMQ4_9GAMM|nr:ribonuclease HII [Shewanella fidelis]MDR8523084.1 ribonuclease HII [Shewanella fidelis]MDW4811590.1 ribonuclease HII [Shewanella fidelis]MDW4815711.1 ribonuclease HII [Shewanella fidelis]MDW4819801.1 ribonuclease HII [Shewanella fidelis]MDW4824225.1 ribonuclease HII [Shewanella fidelis]
MAVIKGITPEQVTQICVGYYAGVDEVGRGPLVGNVVTAAVILDPNNPIEGLNDSKKLSEKKRELLFEQIQQKALSISVGSATPAEIDELNILHATMLAMQRAVAGLNVKPTSVLVDGNRTPDFGVESHAIVKGDGLIDAISAASIIAKVVRDREMDALAAQYPQFGFDKHKGYPTKAHFEALAEHGVLPEHRKSFRPVREALEQS